MIPAKAIKKVKNDIHLEIAAGSLIAYGVFPSTNDGIQKAKQTAASKDTWLAPSDLPEYYEGIDNDLITGKETDGIRAIRRHLKEFYNISSAGTEGYVDTRFSRPTPPAGIQIQWFSINQVGPTTWERLKAQLTGKGYFSEVNLSEKDADELIANIKKSGEFPSLKDQSGIHNEVYQNWLVDTYLPNYGQTEVYNPGDKFVDDGKEFADKIVDDLDTALEEKSDEIMDAIDAIIEEDRRRIEEFKAKVNRKVTHPELYPELQHIKTRYMWGQNGLYDLEFKSDIDRAIYFAGKLGSDKKDSEDKVAVREWLFLVTGLNVRDDYAEIKEYRAKILQLILQLIKLKPQERDVIVPPVYDGYYQDPEEDDEEQDNDDLYGTNLDDLLGEIRDETEFEKQDQEEQKELEEQVSVAVDVLDQAEEAKQEVVEEDLLEDMPDSIKVELEKIINRRRTNSTTNQKSNSSVSNAKIYNFLVTNLTKIQNQFESIDKSIQKQNEILSANFAATSSMIESIEAQNSMLVDRIDALANEYRKQNDLQKALLDEQENINAERKLEDRRDAAGTEGFIDTTKSNKKKRAETQIGKYFKRRAFTQLRRALPKSLRRARIAYKKMQRLPRRMRGRVVNSISKRLPGSVQRAASEMSKIKGAGSVARRIGPVKYALAGAEYADRKAAGQSDLQASAGVGAGLGGAALGGGLVTAGIALLPTAPTGVGAVVAGGLILLGSYLGGEAASKAADKITGAHETGGETKPGIATLHGTELIINKDNKDTTELYNPESTIARTLLGATVGFLNQSGPAAASITPVIKQLASPLIKKYGKPNILVQSDFGGTIPSLEATINKRKTPEEELSEMEKALLEEQNPQTFAEKLMKMLDPEGRFQKLLQQIRNGNPSPDAYDGSVVVGDLKGNIVNPMEQGEIQDYPGAKFGAPRPNGRTHLGRDIVGTPGMKFSAALPGTVSSIFNLYDLPAGGKSKGISIKHENGMETRYLHTNPSVKVGDTVKAGQKLGTITDTDSGSTVPHLHFEVIVNGTHVDPEPLLKGAFKMSDISAGKVPGLTIENYGGTEPPKPEAKVISSVKLNGVTYTEREGGKYYKDGKEVTKEVFNKDKERDKMIEDVDFGSTNIERKKDGGSVEAGTPYWVGDEKGMENAELFIPKTDGTIVPKDQVAGLFSNLFKGTSSSLQDHPYTKQVELEKIKRQMNLPPGKGFTGQYDMMGRPTGYGAMLDKKMYSKPEKNTSEIATNLKQNSSNDQLMIINQQSPAQVAIANMSREVQQIQQNYYGSNKDHASTLKNIVMQRLVG